MDGIVLSYDNSLIRQSDFSLLDPPQWLNDKLIGFYFEFLENHFVKEGHQVSFITPDVTQFIKLYDGPDLKVFLDPLELSNKDLIILAINDNSSSYSSGGTHWSTLVFDRLLNKFLHFDSSSSSCNLPSAKNCARKLTNFLKVNEPTFADEKCPNQPNSYDCGVYAVLFAQFTADRKFNSIATDIDEYISVDRVSKWRKDTKDLILKLSQRSD